MERCSWVKLDEPIYVKYHDEEWGVPVYDDRKLFEMLCLEGAQAGLSWLTILKRREGYLAAFDQFDAEKIVQYDEEKLEALRNDERIIRNRLKIKSVVTNAESFLAIQKQYGSFSNYIWSFVDGKPMINSWESFGQVPITTEISDRMSKQLKKDGFKFVGSTICYSYMQAVGMVNDHTANCHCYKR
ncbi:3-methyladenine DNA glycosylase [Solibacillus silvestris StLB046]|uniref:DNA-3-methyladenine glycosylase I n=1 Tax=Solibacillus silvestris (strain StLB046) TaxID=1002809 RepID=F2F9D0_SOLSS|nr:DNA-3-methyladenine glycosylase I [Solibacillus silvestris]OBW60563.1 DNA-3-methyladenine glycosylase [Solibacillus silvestris]BAK16657.1 3-methyladenine DNA glycosylase [Solibacillus silvestris StLB046]